jgi:hypothetical protein
MTRNKKPRPRTGEKRQVHQPLKVDRLPSEVHEVICLLRARFAPWLEIEKRSAQFVPWAKLPTDVLKLFPGKRIPHSNLQRWYDLRVAQVEREIAEKAEASRKIAAQFAGKEFKQLPEAIRHALADNVFELTQLADQGDGAKFREALLGMGQLIVKFQRNAIAQDKVDVEKGRLEQEGTKLDLLRQKLLGLKNRSGKKLSGKELQQSIDELYNLTNEAA